MKNNYFIFIVTIFSLLSCWNNSNEAPAHTPIKAEEHIIKPNKIIPETLTKRETVANETGKGIHYSGLDTADIVAKVFTGGGDTHAENAVGVITVTTKVTRTSSGTVRKVAIIGTAVETNNYICDYILEANPKVKIINDRVVTIEATVLPKSSSVEVEEYSNQTQTSPTSTTSVTTKTKYTRTPTGRQTAFATYQYEHNNQPPTIIDKKTTGNPGGMYIKRPGD